MHPALHFDLRSTRERPYHGVNDVACAFIFGGIRGRKASPGRSPGSPRQQARQCCGALPTSPCLSPSSRSSKPSYVLRQYGLDQTQGVAAPDAVASLNAYHDPLNSLFTASPSALASACSAPQRNSPTVRCKAISVLRLFSFILSDSRSVHREPAVCPASIRQVQLALSVLVRLSSEPSRRQPSSAPATLPRRCITGYKLLSRRGVAGPPALPLRRRSRRTAHHVELAIPRRG